MSSIRLAPTVILLAAIIAHGGQEARAEAALAVGQPSDVARQGVAVGWSVDFASRAEALARCRGFKDAPQPTRDLCRIVESVRDTCLAIALDPDRGTTGLGWGVHKNREWAEDAAMEKCAQASSPRRRASCQVAVVRCDGQ